MSNAGDSSGDRQLQILQLHQASNDDVTTQVRVAFYNHQHLPTKLCIILFSHLFS